MSAGSIDYPSAWRGFWLRHAGSHSLLRCPGPPCPGGCGANGLDDLAALQDARRGQPLTDEQRRRVAVLLAEAAPRQAACNCGVSKGLRADHEAECSAAYVRPS